jgi:hypothetical protein
MELTGQSYDTFMEMPWLFFEDFYKWKVDMEKEKNKRNKAELENQQSLQRKIKAEQSQRNTRQRLHAEAASKNSPRRR